MKEILNLAEADFFCSEAVDGKVGKDEFLNNLLLFFQASLLAMMKDAGLLKI